jgi:hypothetical protein
MILAMGTGNGLDCDAKHQHHAEMVSNADIKTLTVSCTPMLILKRPVLTSMEANSSRRSDLLQTC